MTDGPRFMPHPDDPPPGDSQPADPPDGGAPPQEPAFGQPAAHSASAPSFQHAPPHASTGMPVWTGSTSEQNTLGLVSLSVSGLSGLLVAILYVNGGVPLLLPLIGGIVGTVFGVRGLNAVRNDRADNRGIALAGTIIGTVTIIAVPLYFLLVVLAVVAFVGTAG